MHRACRRYTTLTTLGLGLIVLAVATMLLAVRQLVAVGNCASSPVFVTVRPCPDSVGALIVLAGAMPFMGALGWALYAQRADRRSPSAWSEGPDWSLWWWPALFFGLGWQFVELGRAFLATDQLGGAIGMWTVAATFALMAAAPLIFTLPALKRNLVGGPAPTTWRSAVERLGAGLGSATGSTGVADAMTGGVGRAMARAVVAAAERRAAADGDAAPAAPAAPVDDLAGDLERLAALYGAGHLTEEEFAVAKAQVLRRARSEAR